MGLDGTLKPLVAYNLYKNMQYQTLCHFYGRQTRSLHDHNIVYGLTLLFHTEAKHQKFIARHDLPFNLSSL